METIGYSGTPLVKKLGIKAAMRLLLVNAPKDYRSWLVDLPEGAVLVTRTRSPVEAAHVFATESVVLDVILSKLRLELKQDGFVWVSWPKKSSKVPTNITDDVIRQIALPLGFVDVKVCAVSQEWSGLKLVIRVAERQ